MNDFIQYVLYELKNSLGLVIPCGMLAAIVTGIMYILFRKKHKGTKAFPWGRILIYLLLGAYLLIVCYATILRGQGSYRREYNFHLFRAWREAWNDYSVKSWSNILLNVAMFIPLGVLPPLLWKKCRNWYSTVPIGFGASLVIEFVQLALGRGICDVDDLFANTLGAVVGFFSIMAILSLCSGERYKHKPFLRYLTGTLLPLLAICSIFVSYKVKEYGNLPNAPAYRNNTRSVTWILDCQLPAVETTATVYKAQTRTPAQCDAFARELAESAGMTVDLTSYYQEYAYYNLRPGGVLLVSYFDDSYKFLSGASSHNTRWTEAERAAIEKVMEAFPGYIPSQASFSYEGDGWHAFTVHRHTDGALMFNGTLRVRYADTGKATAVENGLCTYSYYRDDTILSPEEAYARLKAGFFNDGGYFEYAKPQTVTVSKCVPDYQVDTKGFYQPVYVFSLESADGTYGYNVTIPALK